MNAVLQDATLDNFDSPVGAPNPVTALWLLPSMICLFLRLIYCQCIEA